ncbi:MULTISPECIES: 3-dehydroquinate synthase [Rothia]|uniref:3-dehydroquinate synthase n=1 Tax=Rothia nasimurium TaxID=85336 RepID=A0A1Y1RQH4_9MICC|nr:MULTISPECIES: 3-dehydroquinate synthase [Rothia]ORC22034.1 3-dehydroquinate synthase [Rothia nasimurium]
MSEAPTTVISVTGNQPSENYDVLVGHNLLGEIPGILGPRTQRILVIHPRALRSTGELVMDQMRTAGFDAFSAEIPDAEEGKHIQVAAFCWQVLGQNDFTRTDAIIAVGGGAVTDLAGFVAATWLRGVRVIHVPTTLLGMVDAAVGGKTGINTAEGKNLVGAFHPPAAVLCELGVLRTLPLNELLTGMAEVIKCGFIADPVILDLLEAKPGEIRDSQSDVVRELIERSIRVKAKVVSEDLKESGRREFLNYGHTLGHAIEHAERYQWRHGAAVAVGMVFAAELSLAAGYLDEATVERTRTICAALDLPTSYPADRWPKLLETMRRDKKARGNMLRFVVLEGVGRPRIYEVPDDSILFMTYQEIAA